MITKKIPNKVLKKTRKKKSKKKVKKKISVVIQKDNNAFYRIIITSQNKIMISVYQTLYKKTALAAFNKIIIDYIILH